MEWFLVIDLIALLKGRIALKFAVVCANFKSSWENPAMQSGS